MIIRDTILDRLEELKDDDTIALIAGEEQLSFRQMIENAKRIGRVLVHEGLRKGDRVVLSVGRNANSVCALLGVLYAGGVFIITDQRWPEERIEYIRKETESVLLLDDAAVFRLLNTDPEDAQLPAVGRDDEAAIFYTSGSTGLPKGMVFFHKTIQTLDPALADVELFASSRVLLCTIHFAFGAFLAECSFAINYYKTLLIATEEEMASLPLLAQTMLTYHVDFFPTIPSFFLRLMELPFFREPFSQLKYVALMGERVTPESAERISRVISGCVANHYSSTEVFQCTYCIWKKGEEMAFGDYPDFLRVYLFDEDGKEVGPGGEGEIYFSAPATESGYYLNQPELTKEKFPVHPELGRLCRTGDYGRLREDGKLVLLGRRDNMIKLKGQRVEKGEIEAAMESFQTICLAAVAMTEIGEKEVLCGYYEAEAEIDEAELREHLCRKIPYYMCPQVFCHLSRIPTNTNGKRDYRALPRPSISEQSYCPPENETEAMLCSLFSLVLHLPQVGTRDSFFALGGDSISGMILSSLLIEQGIQLDLSILFRYPTVRDLSVHLPEKRSDRETREAYQSPLPNAVIEEAKQKVFPEETEAVYPVTVHVAQRYQNRGSYYPVSHFFEMNAAVSEEELKERAMELSRKHEALRSEIVLLENGLPVQVVLKEPRTEFFRADLRKLSDGEGVSEKQKQYLSSLIRMEISESTELGRKVFFRVGLVRLSESRTFLYIGFSHYLLDGAGIAAVLQELVGNEPVSPDRTLWERRMQRLYQADRSETEAYWKAFYAQIPQPVAFPKANGNDTRKITFIPGGKRLYGTLKKACAERGITMSVLMTYAIGKSLMKLQDSDAAVFYTMSTGRTAQEMRLPGMFTTSFPVYIKKDDTPEDLQKQLIASDRHAWIFGILDSGFSADGALLSLNVQNLLEPRGVRSVSMMEIDDAPYDPERSVQNRYFAVADTELEVQAWPDARFGFLGWCDPSKYDPASLERLLRGALTELKGF